MDPFFNLETNMLLKILQSSLSISCVILNAYRQIIYTTSPNRITTLILSGNKVFHRMLDQKKDKLPILFGSSLGSIWAACFDERGFIFVLGPFLLSELAEDIAEEAMDQSQIPLRTKHEIMDYLKTVPVINYNGIYPYAEMLHFALNNEKISSDKIETFSAGNSTDNSKPSRRDRMRTYKAELQLMKNIEEGNLNYKESLENARKLSYGMSISTGNPSRQMKNSVITFISLAARAAIRGGLTPEIAYTISDMYTEKVEKVDHLSELTQIGNQMLEEYIRRVHAVKNKVKYSKAIQIVMDHIEMNIEEEIPLSSLAQLTGYTEYYLSRTFKNETGVSINRYIASAKIKRAKLLLDTTDLSVKEIAEKLGFSSETYFSMVFKKEEGISPAKYRSQNR